MIGPRVLVDPLHCLAFDGGSWKMYPHLVINHFRFYCAFEGARLISCRPSSDLEITRHLCSWVETKNTVCIVFLPFVFGVINLVPPSHAIFPLLWQAMGELRGQPQDHLKYLGLKACRHKHLPPCKKELVMHQKCLAKSVFPVSVFCKVGNIWLNDV